MSDPQETFTRRVKKKLQVLETFIKRDLWVDQPQDKRKRKLYHLARMGVLLWEGVKRNDVFLLSAALTYKVTFALMPLLAVMLAFFKGFGALTGQEDRLKEFLLNFMAPDIGTQLATYISTTLENISATAIGIVGFGVLLYTNYSLLHTIEQAFNKVWGIRTDRSFLRRFTAYWTLLTVSPVVIAASLAMTTFVQNHALYVWLTEMIPLFGRFMLIITPVVFAWLALTTFYMFMPNTRVRLGPAFIGAIVAGTSWEIMKSVYVWYNTSVATGSFYGSLATIPVFLLWIYLSWIIVLFGAEVAFAAQHAGRYRREVEAIRVSPAIRDRIALVVCVETVKFFEAGEPAPTDEALAERINAPVRVVHEISYQLVEKGILRRVYPRDGMDPGLMPGRDPGTLTARDVLAAIRNYGDPCALPGGEQADKVYRLIDRAEEEATEALGRTTLKELAAKNEQDGENQESRIENREEGNAGEHQEKGEGSLPSPGS